MEKITVDLSHLVGEATPSTIVDIIDTISTYPDVVDSHREWERADQEWKDVTRNPRSTDLEIMTAAALVREARKKKDSIADAAAVLACQAAENSGVLVDYEDNVLGAATQMGNVEELSPEWHNLRRRGIGGSTVSKVLGFHWKSHVGAPVYYTEEELTDVITDLAGEKASPVTTVKEITSGVLFRGHQWEPALLAYFAQTYDKTVGVSKATWQGGEDFQVVNVDGIILDGEGNPEGIVECKTSSREWTWQWGVPIGYRAQTLWYLNATGLDYAYVIVRFDSGSFDVHRIDATDTVDGTRNSQPITGYMNYLYDTWDTIMDYKNNPGEMWRDNTELRKEKLSTLGYVYDDGGVDEEITHDLRSGVILHAATVAPYERMDEKFTQPESLEVDGKRYNVKGLSTYLYPVSGAYTSNQNPTTTITAVEKMIGDKMIFCVDTPTYEWATRVFGVDGVVNMSAVRRLSAGQPKLEDFQNSGTVIQWAAELFEQ